jgi:hypothetical protein
VAGLLGTAEAAIGAGRPPVARRVEVPPDIGEIKYRDRSRAYDMQQRLRREFEQAFAEGLVVAGFEKPGAYLLSAECGVRNAE